MFGWKPPRVSVCSAGTSGLYLGGPVVRYPPPLRTSRCSTQGPVLPQVFHRLPSHTWRHRDKAQSYHRYSTGCPHIPGVTGTRPSPTTGIPQAALTYLASQGQGPVLWQVFHRLPSHTPGVTGSRPRPTTGIPDVAFTHTWSMMATELTSSRGQWRQCLLWRRDEGWQHGWLHTDGNAYDTYCDIQMSMSTMHTVTYRGQCRQYILWHTDVNADNTYCDIQRSMSTIPTVTYRGQCRQYILWNTKVNADNTYCDIQRSMPTIHTVTYRCQCRQYILWHTEVNADSTYCDRGQCRQYLLWHRSMPTIHTVT